MTHARVGLVDCHTHTLPRRWLDLAERYGDDRWPVRREVDACSADLFVGGKHFRTVPHTCWDAAARLERMDASGVGTQWLSVTPVMFSYWAPPNQAAELARHVNDEIADMVRHAPDRFVGLATLPLGDTDLALAELERAVGELGLRGVEIGTNVAGRDLDHPSLRPVFQAVAEADVPVFVHPWDIGAADRLRRYNAMYTIGMPTETSYAALALLQGNVLGAIPELRVLLAHGAGALAWLLPRIERGWNAWHDRRGGLMEPPGSAARRLWADSLAGDESNLRLAGHRLGWDHLVLGTDYPFPFGEQHAGDVVLESSLDEDIKAAILAGNADTLLTGKP
ncbi:amidohydrolase family protein [Micromonospora deserti]|uniref:2-amino-3-carboxymuconate-6-semialdehyde decarboxylase n=1 Tax=Micromonospora deserti TaxID=2070366 RepID=A0A2W2D900_9ACTN|nr:amidohydrolase family protein [Micromonospora deserti]PZG01835.1 2-amino-3-carboxymuconate-6-semialdehyde decarboxylase [Micromonospora deserti]